MVKKQKPVLSKNELDDPYGALNSYRIELHNLRQETSDVMNAFGTDKGKREAELEAKIAALSKIVKKNSQKVRA